MNPVRDIAIWLQYWLPTSDGWHAAAVPMSMMIVAFTCIGIASLSVWVLTKTGVVKL